MALVSNWKFNGTAKNSVSSCHGKAHNLAYTEGVDGIPEGAALFNGRDSFIEVEDYDAIHLGTGDFTIALWVKADNTIESARGDLLSKFDESARTGFNLTMSASSPGYSSIGDSRNIHFGTDQDIVGEWEDYGKPTDDNSLISTLIVYKGELYTGIADALDPRNACRVYKYAGGKQWIDCGRVGDDLSTRSVFSVLVHEGGLYAGTGTWDWEKTVAGIGGQNRVYRYDGGTTWVDCGAVGTGLRVLCLASFKGNIYAGDDTGRCYRYDGGTTWSYCGKIDEKVERLFSMMVWQGHLYGGSTGNFYRYESGETWVCVGEKPFGNTQIHTLQVYKNRLHAGTWPHGKVLYYKGGDQWGDFGQMGIATDDVQINEIMDLTLYNGSLYAGSIPKSEIYRCEGDGRWSKMQQFVHNEDWSEQDPITWCRVPCLTVFDGKLLAGTGTCHGRAADPNYPEAGRVYALRTGQSVSYNDDIGSGWHHLTIVRQAGELTLYLDGQAVAHAKDTAVEGRPVDLATHAPLLIGSGVQSCFSGAISDLRIYDEALSSDAIIEIIESVT